MKYRVIAFMAVILLSGCVSTTPTKVAYVDTNTLKEKPIKLFVNVAQTELEAVVPLLPSPVGQSLHSAEVARINQKNINIAETNLQPLRDKLLEFEFRNLLTEEVKSQFLTDKLNIVEVVEVKGLDKHLEQIKVGETFFALTVTYKMGAEFRTSFVEAFATLRTKGSNPRKDKIHYQNRFTYFGDYLPIPKKSVEYKRAAIAKAKEAFMSLPERDRELRKERGKYNKALKRAGSDRMTRGEQILLNSSRWQSDMFETLLSDLSNGVPAVVELLNKDFNDNNSADFYATQAPVASGYNTEHKSTIISESVDRLVLRSVNGWSSGSICSTPKTDINQQELTLCPLSL